VKNVTKLEKFKIKQVKNKKNFKKNVEEGIKRQLMEGKKFENKYQYAQQRTRFLYLS
jgi:hypothetical protein